MYSYVVYIMSSFEEKYPQADLLFFYAGFCFTFHPFSSLSLLKASFLVYSLYRLRSLVSWASLQRVHHLHRLHELGVFGFNKRLFTFSFGASSCAVSLYQRIRNSQLWSLAQTDVHSKVNPHFIVLSCFIIKASHFECHTGIIFIIFIAVHRFEHGDIFWFWVSVVSYW
jgi:hypothetical protein